MILKTLNVETSTFAKDDRPRIPKEASFITRHRTILIIQSKVAYNVESFPRSPINDEKRKGPESDYIHWALETKQIFSGKGNTVKTYNANTKYRERVRRRGRGRANQ